MQTAIRLVYPPHCLACGEHVSTEFGLCGACFSETHFITGLVCDACGTPLPGDGAEDGILCDGCLAARRPWSQGRAALLYSGAGRRLVLALKHGDRHDIARAAAPWLARAAAPILRDDSLIVPVPLHLLRLLKRRYNQSALLAQSLARETRCDILCDALVRTRRTPSLDGRTREARFEVLHGAIAVRRSRAAQIAGRHVLLVDDVMTSGATFGAATDALYASGAREVCTLALARVGRDA
ncbi:competence protein ComF [Roseivivax halodurans JCM 10272]|uniref:Competence protein ComF n=1 Tax=Roseivivax halodurans JCM 10272 TaxID=1449350 RepID=X7EG35_9RHOB|nr:competence protein ComF [Roseivivax halodurans JCM 10272]